MTHERLPEELLWEQDHASDVAVSAFADGEEPALSPEVVLHLTRCDRCAMRVGDAALVTRGVTHLLRSMDPPLAAPAPAGSEAPRRPHPVPWSAVFAALGLTVVGVAPQLVELPHGVAAAAMKLRHAAPVVAHSSVQLLHAGLGAQWALVVAACAAVLIVGGLAVARAVPRQTVA